MSYILTKELLDVIFAEAKASINVDDFNERLKNKEPDFESNFTELQGMVKRYVSIEELKTNTDELLNTDKPIEITKDNKKIGIIIPKALI